MVPPPTGNSSRMKLRMPRTLTLVALAIVAAHLAEEVFIGPTSLGSLIANILQILSAVLAFAMCVRASRRGAGFTRPFWILVGCSFLAWGIANFGWVYYETFRHMEPPATSIFPFLVDTRSLFLVIALLLEQKEDSAHLDFPSLLDLVQLVIIFALIYLGSYYVPSLSVNREAAVWRSAEVEIGEDLAVVGLALMQAARGRTRQIRHLYLAIVPYVGAVTAGSIITYYEQLSRDVPSGTWLDLWWTVPYLAAALWAASWEPGPGFYPVVLREKNFANVLLDNTIFALAPLIVLLEASQLGAGWGRLTFSLLGISILCFAARLALSEFRESRSAASAHQAHQDRQEAESKFRVAFQANPESITITTLEDGTYLEVNNAFVAVMGYERFELIGRSAVELDIWVNRQERMSFVDQLRRGERVSDWETRFRTKSGKERQMVLSAHLVQVQGQVCILSMLRDVTEQRSLEQRFHQAQKMEAVGRLAGGVAHDFNNLLMITAANAELLDQSKHDPEKVDRYARQIRIAADRGAVLTRQLLAFSRQQILSPSVLNLNSVITDLWKMVPRLLGEDVETVLSLDPALGEVSADRGQLEQVLMNLAVNARDAMPQGGRLTIRTANVEVNGVVTASERGGISPVPSVLLAVSDTGCGMSTAVQAHIFDPFFTTKELGKGTGLGLATVYGIVRQSGGSISVSSEIGKGSTFKIYLPRVQKKVEVLEGATLPSPAPVPSGSGAILLVEDERDLRVLTSEYLRAQGYQVIEAGTGEAALDICKSHAGRIDLMITDVVMPGSSGPAVAKQVAEMRPGLRTIFMSGYPDRALISDLLDHNVVFFQKPFNLDALARKVHAMLNHSRPLS